MVTRRRLALRINQLEARQHSRANHRVGLYSGLLDYTGPILEDVKRAARFGRMVGNQSDIPDVEKNALLDAVQSARVLLKLVADDVARAVAEQRSSGTLARFSVSPQLLKR